MKGSSRNFPCGFNDDFKVFKSANSSQSHMLLGTEKKRSFRKQKTPTSIQEFFAGHLFLVELLPEMAPIAKLFKIFI